MPGAVNPIGILAAVPDRWGGVWTVRHHVLTRLARRFPTVWVDPPVGWREVGSSDPPGTSRDDSGLLIHRHARWQPLLFRPAAVARVTERLRWQAARQALARAGCGRVILYLWRPEFAPALDYVRHDFSVFHIDDEYTFSPEETRLPPREEALIRTVDEVLIHSPLLMQRKGGINPHTFVTPNGVDYRLFSTPAAEPADLAGIPRPRLGYTGVIKTQLDLRLLDELAGRHPEWSLVLVGPEGTLREDARWVESLRARANVHFLGRKEIGELPGYVQHFDVCLLPYKVNAYTNAIYPLKLHEYLATGRPVISSPIRTMADFPEVVVLAEGVEAWEAAITEALARSADDPRAGRGRELAARHDWDAIVSDMAARWERRVGGADRS